MNKIGKRNLFQYHPTKDIERKVESIIIDIKGIDKQLSNHVGFHSIFPNVFECAVEKVDLGLFPENR